MYSRDAEGCTVSRQLIRHGIHAGQALHIAARDGRSEVLSLLLDAGAIVDAANYSRQTALHLACAREHVDCALLLLAANATMDAAGALNPQDP